MQPRRVVPHKNLAPHGHLEQSSRLAATAEVVSLGRRGILKKDIHLGDIHLPKGQKVIVQSLNPSKGQQLITVYEEDKQSIQADLPETSRNILTGETYFFVTQTPEKYFTYIENYATVKKELFPDRDSPTIDEIRQESLPDCALLAAIQAILNHPDGASYIRGMMYQNEEGDITVRLYHPKTGYPEYVKVSSSVLVNNKNTLLNPHTAMWVHALESAYAARGIKDLDTVMENKSVSTVSTSITPTVALKTLTGVDSFPVSINSYTISPADIPNCLSDEVRSMRDERFLKAGLEAEKFMPALLDSFTEIDEDIIYARYAELVLFQKNNPERFDKMVQGDRSHPLAEFYFQIKEKVKSPGKPFSNTYNAHQLKMFNQLNQELTDKKLIIASIPVCEPIVGLHGKHAYTVLDVSEKMITRSGVPVPARFVKLRNPWGHSGRSYKEESGEAYDHSDAGIFDIELSEFCEFFAYCYITRESASPLFKMDALKEKYLVDIEDFLQTDPANANDMKTIMKEQYICSSHLKNLVDLELTEIKKINSDSLAVITAIFDQKNEATEKELMSDIMDVNLFLHMTGNAEKIKNHVYLLLKLQWMHNQTIQDVNKKSKLAAQIEDNLAYPTQVKRLKDRRSAFNIPIYNRINRLNQEKCILMKQLDDLMESDNLNNIPEILKTFFTLKITYDELAKMRAFHMPPAITSKLNDDLFILEAVLSQYEAGFSEHALMKEQYELEKINHGERQESSLALGTLTKAEFKNVYVEPALKLEQSLTGRQHFGLLKPQTKVGEKQKDNNKKRTVRHIFGRSKET